VTTIEYSIQSPGQVTISVFNVLGQWIHTLVDHVHAPGHYSVTWSGDEANGQQASSGIYLYRIQAGAFTETRKMVLMR